MIGRLAGIPDSATSVSRPSMAGISCTGLAWSFGAGDWDLWLIRPMTRNKVWDRPFGGEEPAEGRSVQQTLDGVYLQSTGSRGQAGMDLLADQDRFQGNKLWDRTFGGAKGDSGSEVQQTLDGGYIITGGTISFGAGDWDLWLIKTDAEGNA